MDEVRLKNLACFGRCRAAPSINIDNLNFTSSVHDGTSQAFMPITTSQILRATSHVARYVVWPGFSSRYSSQGAYCRCWRPTACNHDKEKTSGCAGQAPAEKIGEARGLSIQHMSPDLETLVALHANRQVVDNIQSTASRRDSICTSVNMLALWRSKKKTSLALKLR